MASACALISASASLVSGSQVAFGHQVSRRREDIVALGEVDQRVVALRFHLEIGGCRQERRVGASGGEGGGASGHALADRQPFHVAIGQSGLRQNRDDVAVRRVAHLADGDPLALQVLDGLDVLVRHQRERAAVERAADQREGPVLRRGLHQLLERRVHHLAPGRWRAWRRRQGGRRSSGRRRGRTSRRSRPPSRGTGATASRSCSDS